MTSTPPTDRVALVTGSGRGSGREIALKLATAGASLSHRPAHLDEGVAAFLERRALHFTDRVGDGISDGTNERRSLAGPATSRRFA